MWAAINSLTTDPCVSGPMWPAPATTQVLGAGFVLFGIVSIETRRLA
jgi:hypothetical protein